MFRHRPADRVICLCYENVMKSRPRSVVSRGRRATVTPPGRRTIKKCAMSPAIELLRSISARWSCQFGEAHSRQQTPGFAGIRGRFFGLCSRYPVVVMGLWVLLAAAGNLSIPLLERVIHEHAQFFRPTDAEADVAAVRIGQLFGDSTSDNLTYVVFESDHPLREADRSYYRGMVSALRSDRAHVESMLDLWSSPL